MCDGGAMVRRAGADDLDALVAVLVASHVDYIWEVWAVPADGRADRLAELFRTDLVLLGLRHGEVWTTDEVVSVAVWIPGELAVPPEDAAVRAAVAERTLGPRFAVVEAASAAIAARTLGRTGTLRRWEHGRPTGARASAPPSLDRSSINWTAPGRRQGLRRAALTTCASMSISASKWSPTSPVCPAVRPERW